MPVLFKCAIYNYIYLSFCGETSPITSKILFVAGTNCTSPAPPLNGALSCGGWEHGQMCQMQCNKNWDIPFRKNGHLVCTKADGIWMPADMIPLPDCSSIFIFNYFWLTVHFIDFTHFSTQRQYTVRRNLALTYDFRNNCVY